MKAAVLEALNQFSIKDIPQPDVGPQEVLVKVMAAGTCGSDSHKMIQGWKYGYPAIMGHEFAGQIVALGAQITTFKVGQRVAVIPFKPCFHCYYCQSGYFQMCPHYSMLGQQEPGGFEQYVAVPARNVLDIGAMSYEEGALIEPLAVAVHALLKAQPQVGDTAIVFGLGTIGDLIVRLLQASGVTNIIGVDIDAQKLQAGLNEGCSHVINSRQEDLEKRIQQYTANLGADIVFECAGSQITEEQTLLVTKRGGKILYVGIAYADVMLHQRAFENIFRHELTLHGCWNSYSAPFPGKAWSAAIALVNKQTITLQDLISHKFALDDIQAAFQMITNHTQSYNKVMFYPQGLPSTD